MITNNFISRHVGPDKVQIDKMLDVLGISSIEEMMKLTMPEGIRLKEDLDLVYLLYLKQLYLIEF